MDLVTAVLAAVGRCPASYPLDDLGVPVLVDFDPPLTAEEAATVGLLTALARSRVPPSPMEYAAVREHMQTLRQLRQMGRAAFMAQTAAERDRQLYDAQTATTAILVALLRD